MTDLYPIDELVNRACAATLYEPDLQLNMEICDIIKQRGKSAPRDAAMTLLKHVNGRNQASSLHALTLLDQCVKNCGYAFHLQIASKEFLNGLVKKFSERPDFSRNPVQFKILEFIQQWKQTLCESRYKEDFRNIEAMHEALRLRGYRFPNVNKADLEVIAPKETEEQLEADDRAAQEAKLQELLRRGTPAALEEANELMKDEQRKPNYKSQVDQTMSQIEEKVNLFAQVLKNTNPEQVGTNDTIKELLNAVKPAQARIQKLISEGEDDERIEQLLGLNDQINAALEQYEALKSGKPVVQEPPKVEPQNNVSLIDFDFGEPVPIQTQSANNPAKISNPSSPTTVAGAGLLDDLLGISFNPPSSNALQQPSPNASAPSYVSQSAPFSVNHPSTNPPMSTGWANTSASTQPQNIPRSMNPVASPSAPQSTNVSVLASNVKNLNIGSQAQTVYEKNGLKMIFQISPASDSKTKNVTVSFYNRLPQQIMGLLFQIAVPKTFTLTMPPLSSNIVPPNNESTPLLQSFQVTLPTGQEDFRIRYRLQFIANDIQITDQGEFSDKSSSPTSSGPSNTISPPAFQAAASQAPKQPVAANTIEDLLL